MNAAQVTEQDIRDAIQSLNLGGRPLCVHSSLRSFGTVLGGAETIVQGLLAEDCSLLVPSFTSEFEVSPPAERQYARNGFGDEPNHWPGESSTAGYSTDSKHMDTDLGIVPRTVVAMPGRERGDHPLNSFAAVGPLAADLIQVQSPLDVYAPFEVLIRHDGWVLLMGVTLTSMTLLHLAEARAGRTLFRRWARGSSGEIVEVRLGSCSNGFERLRSALATIERTVIVGKSLWRAYPTAATVELAAAVIRREPEITHCADPACIRCHDIILGGPILDGASG